MSLSLSFFLSSFALSLSTKLSRILNCCDTQFSRGLDTFSLSFLIPFQLAFLFRLFIVPFYFSITCFPFHIIWFSFLSFSIPCFPFQTIYLSFLFFSITCFPFQTIYLSFLSLSIVCFPFHIIYIFFADFSLTHFPFQITSFP